MIRCIIKTFNEARVSIGENLKISEAYIVFICMSQHIMHIFMA